MSVRPKAWAHSVAQLLEEQDIDINEGLDAQSVLELRKQHGPNALPARPGTSFLRLVIKQFEDLLVIILLGAAVVSFGLGWLEHGFTAEAIIEPGVILAILIANAIVGVVQETNAEKAIEKLKELEARRAVAIRDGVETELDSAELVPGDVVKIVAGDKIPADLRCCELISSTISTDESTLTGEAAAVNKHTDALPKAAVAADKRNMLFSGTLCLRGSGFGVVTQTGALTEFGKIQIAMQDSDEDEAKTPLQEKLDEFAELLSKIILVICLLVWAVNIGHFTDPHFGSAFKGAMYYFKIAVALAVAAIPEGLPAVVTTCLALGTKKMARKHAIVRSLPSVETLGCTTVICSDKTGTLTTNKMTVRNIMVIDSVSRRRPELRHFEVTTATNESGFSPYGRVLDESHPKTVVDEPAVEHRALAAISKISAICNEASLHYNPEKEARVAQFSSSGMPTEAALLALAEKLGVEDSHEQAEIIKSDEDVFRLDATRKYWKAQFPAIQTLEFNRERKSMSVLTADKRSPDRQMLWVKGAPELLLPRCSHVLTNNGDVEENSAPIRNAVQETQDKYADANGLRILALAYREFEGSSQPSKAELTNSDNYARVESDLVFVGLVGLLDPPRPEVKQAIRTCNEAGIRVVVITGDNLHTAQNICRQIGVFDDHEDLTGKSYEGADFMQLGAAEQHEAARHANLFARVEPTHKQTLVSILKEQGEVVAMTGDGVNDAPALKRADIGIAMGSGTAVAQEASDMVLQDDNFSTIVMAVEEGRAIYANTKQFIRYLISSNIGEVVCIFLTALLGMPDALIPVQLLWVNLVTDGLPATALGFNKPDADIMKRAPRGRSDKIINGWMLFRYSIIGLYIGAGTVAGFLWWHLMYAGGPQVSFWQLTHFLQCSADNVAFEGVDCAVFSDPRPASVALSILVLIEMFNTFNALSENQSLLSRSSPPWSNIWVSLAVALSVALHCGILYWDVARSIFHTAAMNTEEWLAVVYISFPVIILDEILKFFSRRFETATAPGKAKRE